MNRTALILAAHGSWESPEANASVTDHATRIARFGFFDSVSAAFHRGTPAFDEVLDTLRADRVIVVPFLSSEGYFCDVVLPRELARNRVYDPRRVAITAPIGTHPGMADLITKRFFRRMREYGLLPDETTLAIVGHGTSRHPRSRASTMRLVSRLRRRGVCTDVLAAFLDEPPYVESLLDRPEPPTQPYESASSFTPFTLPHRSRSSVAAGRRNLLVMPFMMTPGPHTFRDLPQRLGLAWGTGREPPFAQQERERLILCDEALGVEPDIIHGVLDLARKASVVAARGTDGEDLRCA